MSQSFVTIAKVIGRNLPNLRDAAGELVADPLKVLADTEAKRPGRNLIFYCKYYSPSAIAICEFVKKVICKSVPDGHLVSTDTVVIGGGNRLTAMCVCINQDTIGLIQGSLSGCVSNKLDGEMEMLILNLQAAVSAWSDLIAKLGLDCHLFLFVNSFAESLLNDDLDLPYKT